MMYIIDGTGVYDDKDYAAEMENGFCKRLQKLTGGVYARGPSTDGLMTFQIADRMLKVIRTDRKASPKEPIYLAGHSRGGAASIYIAKQLAEAGIPVRALFLYDAVDRTLNWSDLDVIPGNVRVTYHARRDASLSNYYEAGTKAAQKKWEACLAANRGNNRACDKLAREYEDLRAQNIKMKRAMRSAGQSGLDVPEFLNINFGNCGTSSINPKSYFEQFFLGSHGALGGAPITDKSAPRLLIDSDRAAIASVHAWMSANMTKEGALKPAKA